MSRLRVDPMDRWRDDPEPRLVRELELGSSRAFAPTIEVRVDRRASDEALAGMFGWPARATTRLTGSVANAGVAAIDGDPATAWITAFGQANGASLTIDGVAGPVDHITVAQPAGEFSVVTELIVRSGGEERYVYLAPEADGSTGSRIVPPLPSGTVEVVVAAIEHRTTLDRRHADTVELPAAISELTIPGLPAVTPVTGARATVECAPIVNVDGVPQPFTFTLEGQQAIDGEAAVATPCGPPLELGAGAHRVESADIGAPIQLDRVVLADPARRTATSSTAEARVIDDGRFEQRIEVTGCSEGCWLVFGAGHSTAWTAETDDGSLGEPQLVDGGFNGWWIAPSIDPVEVTVAWTRQTRLDIALGLSALGVILAIVLLVLDRRRNRSAAAEPIPDARFLSSIELVSIRRAVAVAVAWTALSGLLVAPVWGLAGAVAGVVVILSRRIRIVELTAWATLVTVGALVTVRERRNAPAPNGGWPGVFESWHRLASFAVVSVLVAALFAVDAERTNGEPPDE
jgi:arabinofuranan 3-O-arabinosyltransferase